MFSFSPDTMLVVGCVAFLFLAPRIWVAVRGKLPAMPSLPSLKSGVTTSGAIADPHDLTEQIGFAHIQGAIHALKSSLRVKPEEIEMLAALAGKLLDLVEPAVPVTPAPETPAGVKP